MTSTLHNTSGVELHGTRPQSPAGFRSHIREHGGVLIALSAVAIFLCITQPAFRTWSNVVNIVGSNSVALMLALGATFVIIAGGIDLSAAAVPATAGMVFGVTLRAGWPLFACIVATTATGALVGFVNGLLIARAGISFLVVTLGMTSVATSAALVISNGTTVNVFSADQFSAVHTFATGSIGGISIIFLFDIAVIASCAAVLRYTRFGRSVFAIGSNAEAARMNGIDVSLNTVYVYLLAGCAAGIAGIIQVGRLTGASPQIDASLLNGVLAAVLIGGTAFSGGRGSILGTALGVLFLGVVQNAMTLSDLSSFWRQGVNGVLLISAVWLGLRRSSGISLRGVLNKYLTRLDSKK